MQNVRERGYVTAMLPCRSLLADFSSSAQQRTIDFQTLRRDESFGRANDLRARGIPCQQRTVTATDCARYLAVQPMLIFAFGSEPMCPNTSQYTVQINMPARFKLHPLQ